MFRRRSSQSSYHVILGKESAGSSDRFQTHCGDNNGCRVQDEKAAHRARSFDAGRSGNARDIHTACERP